MPHAFRWIGKSADGETVTLRRFSGQFSLPEVSFTNEAERLERTRKGAVLDVETTGFRPGIDAIIEIGVRFFTFDRLSGKVLEVGESVSAFEDPGRPIPPEITRLTGITDEDVRGQRIPWSTLGEALQGVDLIVAHNARFDRPFVELRLPELSQKIWGCSLDQIAWSQKGFPSAKLEFLAFFHGFFVDAHRALEDADALLHLLTFEGAASGRTYLNELLVNARRSRAWILALSSPFEKKDELKRRGYIWDTQKKTWMRMLYLDEWEEERAWLEEVVYNGDFLGRVREIPLQDLYKRDA